jgi:CHAT domain-containing protein
LAEAATTAVPDIPPLPDTRDEIRAIAASLGADPDKDAIYGAEATRERIKTMNLADKRIIAFATHGLIPGDMPGLTQPALTLAYEKDPRDSLLLLEDILKLRLDADWVVLRACNTGAADGLGNEAASGLGRGFFYAGSRALLLTHWPVESESAKRLVTQIFTLYSNQTPRAIAVKKSADMLIDSPGYLDPQSNKLLYSYAHPMFWAPYTLIGDSR